MLQEGKFGEKRPRSMPPGRWIGCSGTAEDDAHVLGEGPGDAEVEGADPRIAALVVDTGPELVRDLRDRAVPGEEDPLLVGLEVAAGIGLGEVHEGLLVSHEVARLETP